MRLWACWTSPPLGALAPGDAVLSFLPPAEEEVLPTEAVTSARRLPAELRARARAAYVAACARPPAAPGLDGRTLREAVASGPGTSPWWYHPTSYRDCESDPAFGHVLAAMAVRAAAAERGLSTVTLCGAPEEVALGLAPSLAVEAVRLRTRAPRARWWLRALAARARAAWGLWREAVFARRVSQQAERFDVLLAAFWDWSLWARDGGLADRYYKALPAELAARGLKIGWLAWLDPEGEPGKTGRPWSEVTAPLAGREDVSLLQARLSADDILRAFLDFRPARAYLAWRRRADLKSLYAAEGLDLWPFFEERLLRGFLDGCLPRASLFELAAARAARAHAPRLVLSFLEHHPVTRALLTGVRAGAGALCAAIQHSNFCPEKTFYFLDPETDFRGRPDGRAAPCPDVMLAMGTMGRGHFIESGYPPERVLLTGSPRYDHVRLGGGAAPPRAPGPARVLAVSTLDTAADIDMVEALALAAREGPPFELRVRDHPFSRIADQPRFAPLAGRVALSRGTLAEDLAWADLVVYTYSTVAEEAVLQGKPVWQWLPLAYNASPLAEAAPPPQFASAAELRRALAAFAADPAAARPSEETRRAVQERLFFPADGQAAARAAEALAGLLAGAAPTGNDRLGASEP